MSSSEALYLQRALSYYSLNQNQNNSSNNNIKKDNSNNQLINLQQTTSNDTQDDISNSTNSTNDFKSELNLSESSCKYNNSIEFNNKC